MEIIKILPSILLVSLILAGRADRLRSEKPNSKLNEHYTSQFLHFSEPEWESKFPRINDRPVIGILTHENQDSHREYFSADYVKFLRTAAARVVPLSFKWSDERLKNELGKINGAVATGGGDLLFEGDQLTQYSQKVKVLLDFSREELDNNRYFAVWGVCMGMEAMHIILTNQTRALGHSQADRVLLPLIFKENYKRTQMYKKFPNRLIEELKTRPLTFHSHSEGIPLSFYEDQELGLNKIFNVLTTSFDPSGVEIVTSVSHKELPIYGVMFHPEKAPFDFGVNEHFTHDADAIELSVQLANFFVFEARRSKLRYDFDEMSRNVIQNYEIEYMSNYLYYGYYFDDGV